MRAAGAAGPRPPHHLQTCPLPVCRAGDEGKYNLCSSSGTAPGPIDPPLPLPGLPALWAQGAGRGLPCATANYTRRTTQPVTIAQRRASRSRAGTGRHHQASGAATPTSPAAPHGRPAQWGGPRGASSSAACLRWVAAGLQGELRDGKCRASTGAGASCTVVSSRSRWGRCRPPGGQALVGTA